MGAGSMGSGADEIGEVEPARTSSTTEARAIATGTAITCWSCFVAGEMTIEAAPLSFGPQQSLRQATPSSRLQLPAQQLVDRSSFVSRSGEATTACAPIDSSSTITTTRLCRLAVTRVRTVAVRTGPCNA
jgi:hypothetical protein